jgi:DNA-binding MarR family transcriptional regulator
MHSITFMLKRAHWRNVAFAKTLVEKVHGMTPARFELLYMLRRVALVLGVNEAAGVSKVQTDLWKDLGLHRSTVCKLIKRLVNMGWVRRQRNKDDRRTFDVFLTAEGLSVIWRSMRRVFRSKTLKKEYERLLGPRKPEPWDEFDAIYDPGSVPPPPTWKTTHDGAPMHTCAIVHGVYETIRRIASFFGDRSRLWFDLGNGLPPGNGHRSGCAPADARS